MPSETQLAAAAAQLRGVLSQARTTDSVLRVILEARDAVLSRYQPVFSPENLPKLAGEEFRQFLVYKNNLHWVSLQRLGPYICADMDRLRRALAILVDESQSIRSRLNELVPPHGRPFVPRLHKAVLTPILLIAFPAKYGVWNQISEDAMKTLGVWPDLEPSDAFGDKYAKVNAVLLQIANMVGVDLWTLDALVWRIVVRGGPLAEPVEGLAPADDVADETVSATAAQRFGLERHLQEFLRDNWEKTPLGKEWRLYEEDGDPEAGYEYPCGIGRIDLLAKHRTTQRWLVIELKRTQSSDQTVGQVLRYMGWVAHHLAAPSDSVEGLVIAHEADEGIAYALRAVPSVRLQLYEVEFRLKEGSTRAPSAAKAVRK